MFDDEVHTLAYFHKDSVTSCEEIKKDCDKKEEIEKDCDKKEEIEKDCDKKGEIKKDCKKIDVRNKMNSDEFRSSRQFQTFYFFYKKSFHTQKARKAQKA